MRTLPKDASLPDHLDHCSPVAGLHSISCLVYIPIFLSFNYRYRQHRLPDAYPADSLTKRKPIEVNVLLMYLLVAQLQILAYELGRFRDSDHSTLAFILHPVTLLLISLAVGICRWEEKFFHRYITEPYKAILPALPGWEKIREEKRLASEKGYRQSVSGLQWACTTVKQHGQAMISSTATWFFPYTVRPLPLQTPMCLLVRYHMRAFVTARMAALCMTLSAFSSCKIGFDRWLEGGYEGRSGTYDLRNPWSAGWLFAAIVFIVQCVRIQKQSEIVGQREGIEGYKKDTIS